MGEMEIGTLNSFTYHLDYQQNLKREKSACTMLYTLGDAEDVLLSTNISEENRKNYVEVMAKLDRIFRSERM